MKTFFKMNVLYFKRYKIRNMPVDFLESDMAQSAILQCIYNIEYVQAVQNQVDTMYESICNTYYDEMDLWFKSHNINKVGKN